MIVSMPHLANEKTFTLSVDGKPRLYHHNKEGRRQAIIDGLNAIQLVTVGPDTYLSSNEALQVVAAVLYPLGIQTETAYQLVRQVTEKACAHLGYGSEVELTPPVVPFSARGLYRKRYPPVDTQMVLDELALSGTNSEQPRYEVSREVIWNRVGFARYGRYWNNLTAAEQTAVQQSVDAIATQAGWAQDSSRTMLIYAKPLAVDEDAVRRRLGELIQQANGRPLLANELVRHIQLSGYGRGFYNKELTPPLQTLLTEALKANKYQLAPEDNHYWPLPISLEHEEDSQLIQKLEGIEPRMTEQGPVLLLQDLVAAISSTPAHQTMNEWQVQHLLKNGRVQAALRQLGYRTDSTWCPPYQFSPPLTDRQSHQVIFKELRIQNNPLKTISLANGFSVHTPALAIDDVDETLVYLQMVGSKQAVRANWAALVGGGKVHWLGRQRIRLNGMKAHIKTQVTLPCGWLDHILIHKQASLKEMNPELPFYLLDDGSQPIPPLFYPMLNKCLALPLLPQWTEYLWDNGRVQNLITLLNEGQGQTYAAWRLLPAADEWQGIVENGLASYILSF